jgi:hypothetical protein
VQWLNRSIFPCTYSDIAKWRCWTENLTSLATQDLLDVLALLMDRVDSWVEPSSSSVAPRMPFCGSRFSRRDYFRSPSTSCPPPVLHQILRIALEHREPSRGFGKNCSILEQVARTQLQKKKDRSIFLLFILSSPSSLNLVNPPLPASRELYPLAEMPHLLSRPPKSL